MKVKKDHRSEFSNLSNWKEEAWKKNQGFNGIRTRDLRVVGALLYQLSYEATHWERGQFIEFISPVRSEMMWSIWNNSYRKLWLNCRPNVTYNTHNVQYVADTWILGWVTNWDDQSWVKYLSCKNSYIHFHKLFLHLKDTVLQTTNRLRLLGWIHKAFLWLDVSEVLSLKNGPLLRKNPLWRYFCQGCH